MLTWCMPFCREGGGHLAPKMVLYCCGSTPEEVYSCHEAGKSINHIYYSPSHQIAVCGGSDIYIGFKSV